MSTTPAPRTGKRYPGPPLAAPAALFAVLFLAALLTGPILGAGTMPSPFGDAGSYFADSRRASQVGGVLLLSSALGLALFSGVAMSRLTFLAPNAPGPTIAGVGGLAAAGLLAVAGLVQWTLSRGDVVGDPAVVHALRYAAFAAGGPAHTVALAVLVLGTTVTSWFVDRTPRRLTRAGFAIAAVCLLSGAALLAPELTPLVVVGRFAAIAWLVAVAILLPRDRGPRREAGRARAVARAGAASSPSATRLGA